MTAADLIPFGPVVAWSLLLVNLLIIPFYSKSENLHKDYIDSGSLDAATSFIEAQKLIPILAAMFEKAIASQGTQEEKLEMKDLLQSVDFLPDLEKAETAMREKRTLEDTFEKLQVCAGKIWKTGVVHGLAVIAIPFCFLIPHGWYFLPIMLLTIAIAVFFFGVTGFRFYQFNKHRELFLNGLKSNRQKNA